jgi:hypothetical protein
MLDETGEQAAAVGDDPVAQGTWMALAYTIFIGGIVGFGLWFWLIARCITARVAPFALLLPVLALISSVLFRSGPHDPDVSYRGATRHLGRRHYASETDRSTKFNLKVASWRLPSLVLSTELGAHRHVAD